MKKYLIYLFGIISCFFSLVYAQAGDEVGRKAELYFEELFGKLKSAAEKAPDSRNFREVMKPAVETIEGFYGATLVDSDWVIREVYSPAHFLARGFDLKKVKELEYFRARMRENPSAQLSEPAHGSIFQPRLISMRYPISRDGKFGGFISMMVRTDVFLKAAGLDKAKAYKIICLGRAAEEKGELSPAHKEAALELPSTKWEIYYEQ